MNNNIDVYNYIASNSPRATKKLIRDFGYQYNDQNLADCLKQVVQKEGEDAVIEIMKIHPDYEYFQDLFDKKQSKTDKKSNKKTIEMPNFGGFSRINSENSNNSNGIIMLACTMILTVAIITYK